MTEATHICRPSVQSLPDSNHEVIRCKVRHRIGVGVVKFMATSNLQLSERAAEGLVELADIADFLRSRMIKSPLKSIREASPRKAIASASMVHPNSTASVVHF